MTTRALVEDVVAANQILAAHGVLDAYGHVSARAEGAADRYLMSWSLAPELVRAADVLEHDFDGAARASAGRTLYLERFIHGEVYRRRADVGAVVHCHSPGVIPFGVSDVPLRPIFHTAAFLGESVPVFDIRDATGEATDMLIRTAPLGQALAGSLGDAAAVLMRGHGAVIVGPTVPEVVFRAIYLEVNARLQARALALGGRVRYLDREEARRAEAALAATIERPWTLWKRSVLGAQTRART